MQIVIDIDDEKYNVIRSELHSAEMKEWGLEAIRRGAPLPKGHGRLIDESKIKKCGWNFIDHHAKTDAPTIIKADREE